jgi:tripartite ATP-independent transporter DctP family solute receptor
MRTRSRLSRVLDAVLGASLMASTSLASAEAIKLRISTPAVENDWHAQMLYVFKDWLERSAPGEFNVEVHLNATLFKQGTEPAAMQRGNLDMAMISAQDISKQIAEWSIFTAGYLIRDPDHQQAVFNGPIGEEMYAKVHSEMGLEVLTVAYLGTRQLNLREDKKISTPEDLAGTKLRMPGSKSWQFLGKALGAFFNDTATTEIYTALQTGTVDGQDNPLPTDKAAKFYEVTKQIVLTSHLVDGVFLTMSGKTWAKLNDTQKTLVRNAARAAAQFNNENRLRDEANLVAFFKEQGMQVYPPDVAAFRSRVQKMYLESEFSKDWPKGMVERVNAVQ